MLTSLVTCGEDLLLDSSNVVPLIQSLNHFMMVVKLLLYIIRSCYCNNWAVRTKGTRLRRRL